MYMADFHGRELLWRKFLSAQKKHDVDVSIVSGDLSAKKCVPIIEQDDGTYKAVFKGNKWTAENEEKLEGIKKNLRKGGVYPCIKTMQEVRQIQRNPQMIEQLFRDVSAEELDRILDLVEEKNPEDTTVIVTPGNDDPEGIDEVIKEHENIVYPLGKAISFPTGHELISFEYTNPTPWNTPREVPEEQLWEMLLELRDLTSGNWSKVIANFHCPPRNTRIDLAPELDKNQKPVYRMGKPQMTNVGSKSVRKFLEEYQPYIGLHGHIHESPGHDYLKRTELFNPGSEYQQGIFKAIVLDLSEDGLENWFRIG
ncbi:MAG: phosphoesterase [Candidatus Thorarchaeota archaeon]|nr:phosphoesterase [Candidatus Thorarchaeota archaeon]NIW15695.1 phosphoesterase [Candidatus Thorarchaeota archaeon]NIW52059.1 phosphoesterase [Candidatus Korarchaeota archaeon]